MQSSSRQEHAPGTVPFGPVRLRRDVETLTSALAERLADPALADAVRRTLQCCGRGFRCRRPAVAPAWTVAPLAVLPSGWPVELADTMAETLPSATARTDFLTWFLWDRLPADGGPPLGWRLYLDMRDQLPASLARTARALWRSHYNVYEVLSSDGVERLEVRDLVFGESVVIHDRSLAVGLSRWDQLVVRLVRDGNVAIVHALHSVLPPGARAALEGVVHGLTRPASGGARRRCVLSQLKRQPYEFLKRCESIFEECADPPELTNLDGEPLVDTRVYFRLTDREATEAALARSPFIEPVESDRPDGPTSAGARRFVWLREGRRRGGEESVRPVLGTLVLGDRFVIVECNSRERGLAFRQGLTRVLAGAAEYTSTVHVDFEQQLLVDALDHGEHPWPAETILDDTPPSRALLQAYHQWLDSPLVADAAAQGFTPREAARSAPGRWWLARFVNRLDTVQLEAGAAPTPIFFDLDVIRRVIA